VIELDPAEIAAIIKARSAQQYADMLDEIARLTVYCNQLTAQNEALRAQVSTWQEKGKP
jgi:cell division protein FtsB